MAQVRVRVVLNFIVEVEQGAVGRHLVDMFFSDVDKEDYISAFKLMKRYKIKPELGSIGYLGAHRIKRAK